MTRLENFFYDIKELLYVVQRNFENLPETYVVGEHNDLDLFCAGENKLEALSVVAKYPEFSIDVRSEKDCYYPIDIGKMLLEERDCIGKIIYIPNRKAHFFSLFYHNAVHKENNPYGEKLRHMFLETFPPVKCKDEGVGYFVHGID